MQKRGGVIQVVVGARIHAVASAPPPLCSSSIKASVHTHRGARGAAFGRGPPLCYPRAAGTVRRPPGDLRGDRSGCRGTFSRVAHDAAGVVWVESWPGGQKRVSPSVGATDGAPVPRGVKRTNWILTVGLVFRSYRRYSVKRGGRVLVRIASATAVVCAGAWIRTGRFKTMTHKTQDLAMARRRGVGGDRRSSGRSLVIGSDQSRHNVRRADDTGTKNRPAQLERPAVYLSDPIV